MTRIEIRKCPLCEWEDRRPAPDVPQDALASVFGRGTAAAAAAFQHAVAVERALQEHLSEHTTVEWLTEVMRLRSRVEAMESASHPG